MSSTIETGSVFGGDTSGCVIGEGGASPTTPAPEPPPIPMLLWCPECGERHVDEGEYSFRAHHTHACQHCGHVWRPAIVATTGVRFLPGFKNDTVVARTGAK